MGERTGRSAASMSFGGEALFVSVRPALVAHGLSVRATGRFSSLSLVIACYHRRDGDDAVGPPSVLVLGSVVQAALLASTI